MRNGAITLEIKENEEMKLYKTFLSDILNSYIHCSFVSRIGFISSGAESGFDLGVIAAAAVGSK